MSDRTIIKEVDYEKEKDFIICRVAGGIYGNRGSYCVDRQA